MQEKHDTLRPKQKRQDEGQQKEQEWGIYAKLANRDDYQCETILVAMLVETILMSKITAEDTINTAPVFGGHGLSHKPS